MYLFSVSFISSMKADICFVFMPHSRLSTGIFQVQWRKEKREEKKKRGKEGGKEALVTDPQLAPFVGSRHFCTCL